MTRRTREWMEALGFLWKAPLWLAFVLAAVGFTFVALPASVATLLAAATALAAAVVLLLSPTLLAAVALGVVLIVALAAGAAGAAIAVVPPILFALLCIGVTALLRRAVVVTGYAASAIGREAQEAWGQTTAVQRRLRASLSEGRRAAAGSVAALPELVPAVVERRTAGWPRFDAGMRPATAAAGSKGPAGGVR